MDTPTAPHSVPVPDGATPAEAIRARWAWTAPEVWTDRMLTTLEQGVRGGRWHTLIDKVYAPLNLRAACERVVDNKGAAGVDPVTVDHFHANRQPQTNPKRTPK